MSHTEIAESKAQAGQLRYDSLLVHVEPAQMSSRRTHLAARLARRFDARLIGLGAEAVEPLFPAEGYAAGAEYALAMTELVNGELKSAEAAFARDAQGCETEWRSALQRPAAAVAAAARAADLIVTGASTSEFGDSYRHADPAELALTCGRPVLVAPADAVDLRASTVVVAWKDTREARRAVMDALPILIQADEVLVLAVAPPDQADAAAEQTKDVSTMLRRRRIPASSAVIPMPHADVPSELNRVAATIGADLIVAGAYGHSRLAEWALGGVTQGLLRNPQRYLLLSH